MAIWPGGGQRGFEITKLTFPLNKGSAEQHDAIAVFQFQPGVGIRHHETNCAHESNPQTDRQPVQTTNDHVNLSLNVNY